MRSLLIALAVAVSLSACGKGAAPSLAIGAAAPDFSLPGIDGKTHGLVEFAASKVLAIIFTCNTCPAAQLYEARIRALDADYRGKGVAVVAINPNRADAMQLADLAHTDVGESLDDMKVRATHRGITYPYLSDGATQSATRSFGVVATPQIFVFDQARRLRYQGRIDDSVQESKVASHDARAAIDALLAGGPVRTAVTPAAGCPVKSPTAPAGRDEQLAGFERAPVSVETIDADGLKRLRQNGTGKLLLVNFWATWCAPCASEFPDLETTYRMYQGRNLEFVAVSVNDPAERPAVLQFLTAHHASHPNRQFATADVYGLQAAFDPKMPAPVPFTLLLAPNGDVLYQELGESDIPKLRRAILANLPDDGQVPGLAAYWSTPEK